MSTFDISETLAPKSEQLDAIDLHQSGPRVFTVEKVTAGSAEQPVQIHLVEFDRPWRPSKSMRRVLADCWGPEASQWTGRRFRLWCDPRVSFGGQEVGGVRILAVSHIDKPKSVPLIVTRGKAAMYKVDPLPAEDPAATLTAARERVKAAAPKDKDLRTWVPAALDARGLDGTKPADLIKLAEELEAQP